MKLVPTRDHAKFDVEVMRAKPFREASEEAQVLYFHLNFYADGAGYVTRNEALEIAKMCRASKHAIDCLLEIGYLGERSGQYHISHWKCHNA